MSSSTMRLRAIDAAGNLAKAQLAGFSDAVKRVLSKQVSCSDHRSVFEQGELVVIKNYTFKVGYIGENVLLLEPVGPQIIGND